jgi:hypothetical protein
LLPGNQIREKTCSKTVRHYADLMEGGEDFIPITITPTDPADEAKGFTLVDGWHRVRASQLVGSHSIKAFVVPATPEEIPWLAVQANRRHGLPLTRADRRKAFRAYVKARQHRKGRGNAVKSAREMAKDLNGVVTRHTLPVWMAADFPAIYAAMIGNGLEADADQGGLKSPDMDKVYARAARASLEEFMANMRSISDNRVGWEVLRQATEFVTEVSEAVTGKREWPKAHLEIPSDF